MNATPGSNYSSGHGLVGLPGGQSHDIKLSRTHTPLQQYQQGQVDGHFMSQGATMYPDQGYQQSVDANFGMNFGHESHFSEAIGDLNATSGFEGMPQNDGWLDPALNDNPQTDYSFALAE